jgi:TetR/AcrR family transcriptional regulator, transcriptional repressor for nem operon
MRKDGTQTRQRILDAALQLSLDRGMAAASLDNVIEKAGITKGAFFYHFKSKQALTDELMRGFVGEYEGFFRDLTGRAESLSRDPLQQVLLLVGLAADAYKKPPENPGCLVASYCYQGDLWTDEARKIFETEFLRWSEWILRKLKQAAKTNPPAVKTDLRQVAEMFTGVFEGAYILGRTYNDRDIISKQLLTYRDLVEALFTAR